MGGRHRRCLFCPQHLLGTGGNEGTTFSGGRMFSRGGRRGSALHQLGKGSLWLRASTVADTAGPHLQLGEVGVSYHRTSWLHPKHTPGGGGFMGSAGALLGPHVINEMIQSAVTQRPEP